MTISAVRPLPVGNAIQLIVAPPAGALKWRVLRQPTDAFTDQTNGHLVFEGNATTVLDFDGLRNEVPVFYRTFYWDGSAWAASTTAQGTARQVYTEHSTDALIVVRDRLEVGLRAELDRQMISSPHGFIQVFSAPPVADAETRFPLFTVHLASERPGERGIGESIDIDEFVDGDWLEHEGWMADVRIEILAWCLNPDHRIQMRQAMRRIVVANLPVFDAAGMVEVTLEQSDVDLVSGEYDAPMFQAMGTLTCKAPIIVRSAADPIDDVQLQVTAINP